MSSWWLPCSATTPPFKKKMTCEFLIVESLWATEIVVSVEFSSACSLSIVACTSFSESLSSAEVASSRSRICGCLISALAMAIRCFWPPDIWPPPMPTYVSSFFGKASRNSQACACLQTALIFSSEMLLSPPVMFVATVVAKSTGSWPT
mmetsp:Transcript_14725/g.42212  ORF Transcript_14725/g.42212 Transcript_14725/m.42212 type:complete len:149 (-) Transcript_14725:627-1073(-)